MKLIDQYICLRIVAPEPERMLTNLLLNNIEVFDIKNLDFITIELRIHNKDYARFIRIAEKNGASCKIVSRLGLLWNVNIVLSRPVLCIGLTIFLAVSLLLNEMIFFVRVEGNTSIPDNQILDVAESCGISFGAFASKVRSENAKNRILMQIPQLQWIGITTSGTVATIHVKERSMQDTRNDQKYSVGYIVANRDGILSRMTVYRGNPLFQPGESVCKGDILVSGYTDCGIFQKAECADAEVFAYTARENLFVFPVSWSKRGNSNGSHTCISFRIGKKVINLCNHSGIWDATCVKMYSEDYWSLPGGFRLPLSVMKVEHIYYDTNTYEYDAEMLSSWLPQFARTYLLRHMVAGQILNEELRWETLEQVCILNGYYACHEMIGQVKYEEIIERNAEDN